ncbi:unnamed protein product [Effrenium voratum]|uniref:Uncharacterized protein n=1 Tax=Effrenium voratum TaxID=2562239 RepID=A0AA36N1C0_9DINO|nr:unnamed protein product [Effrenium voratum]
MVVQLHDERLRALPSVDKEFRHPALAAGGSGGAEAGRGDLHLGGGRLRVAGGAGPADAHGPAGRGAQRGVAELRAEQRGARPALAAGTGAPGPPGRSRRRRRRGAAERRELQHGHHRLWPGRSVAEGPGAALVHAEGGGAGGPLHGHRRGVGLRGLRPVAPGPAGAAVHPGDAGWGPSSALRSELDAAESPASDEGSPPKGRYFDPLPFDSRDWELDSTGVQLDFLSGAFEAKPNVFGCASDVNICEVQRRPAEGLRLLQVLSEAAMLRI